MTSLLIVLLLLASPRQQAEPCFSPEQVQEDVEVLCSSLLSMHPSLDRTMSMDEARGFLDSALATERAESSEAELFSEVSRILARIGCLHTSARPSAASVQRALASPTLLPIGLGLAEGRAILVQDLTSEAGALRGAELVAIDDRSVAEAIAFIGARRSADGFITTAQRRRIERLFFWHYRWSFGPRESFALRVREGGRERTVVVPGVDYATRKRVQARAYPQDDPENEEAVSLRIDDDGIAHLRIASFWKDGGDADWFADRFDEAFAEIREAGAADLIIDVRDNGGGWDESPADLFAHLSGREFATYRRLSRVVEDAPRGVEMLLDPVDFSEYAPAPADLVERIREPGVLGALVDHYIRSHPMVEAVWSPADAPYEGRVWVLINGGSGSSGSEFPSYVKYHARGTLVGEETGGGYAGCTAGILPEVVLPNSGIRVRIPLIRYELAYDLTPEQASRGVRPDVVVRPTVEDVRAGHDPVLERTLELIEDARETAPARPDHAR